ncbi:2'-5' RNA ligase family protein [Limosilactobacillus balticus]|uniref:2'-5' RNA ligase family protein n=1 Tax=Limosilactobacillus balticus TaxID=2759747 RepID=UPI001E437FC6|nr:2'-5' RNA ligase family protein [Limosilactobacillus balticus]MCD7133043.1 2'-5' RNA ligase family protein [Limosilactobacillus balticus]
MQLATLYNNINQQGISAIRNHQEQLDSNLLNPDKDMRRGLTLTASLPAHVSRNIMFCLQKLAAIEPNQYFYPPADLHITIIDLIPANSDFSLSTFEEKKYKNVVGQIISQIGPIHWHLAGMIPSLGALLVKGYYSAELSTLRNQLRQELPLHNLLLKERYPTISGHVTVARYTRPLQQADCFLEALEGFKSINFGQFTTSSLDLVVHDWYNHNSQLISKLSLRS